MCGGASTWPALSPSWWRGSGSYGTPTDQARYAFTQLTVNADEHKFMRHFHRSGDEKRSLVILRPDEYNDWLNCRNPEISRTFLQTYPAELLAVEPKVLPTQ